MESDLVFSQRQKATCIILHSGDKNCDFMLCRWLKDSSARSLAARRAAEAAARLLPSTLRTHLSESNLTSSSSFPHFFSYSFSYLFLVFQSTLVVPSIYCDLTLVQSSRDQHPSSGRPSRAFSEGGRDHHCT